MDLMDFSVSGFPTYGTVLIAMFCTVIYTTLGGLRGVIWTDVFQTTIMYIGLATIMIMVSSEEYISSNSCNFAITNP